VHRGDRGAAVSIEGERDVAVHLGEAVETDEALARDVAHRGDDLVGVGIELAVTKHFGARGTMPFSATASTVSSSRRRPTSMSAGSTSIACKVVTPISNGSRSSSSS
jgi:hypothetical protein